MKKEIVSEPWKNSMRDEQTLAKVLEAAYVIQERNRELQKKNPTRPFAKNQMEAIASPDPHVSGPLPSNTLPSNKADSALTLAHIVEIQHQIQVRHLELENVMSLVVDRLTHISGVSSVAIGMVEGKQVHYRASAGALAPPLGNKIPVEKALGIECLRSGQIFRCADVTSALHLDHKECRRRGIQGMIAAPVFNDGGVAGILEIYFPATQAFTGGDVHACQLMAGLVSEALARNEKIAWKKSISTERAVMLEALERLKPDLATLADPAADKDSLPLAGTLSTTGTAASSCSKCGHELVGQEQFCGNCGSPRSSDYAVPKSGSTKATPWHMQAETVNTPPPAWTNGADRREESNLTLGDPLNEQSVAGTIGEPVIEPYKSAELVHQQPSGADELSDASVGADFEASAHADLEIASHTVEEGNVEWDNAESQESKPLSETPERTFAWSSAATTRNFLEQLGTARASGTWAQFWNTRRGDIYLAVAVILVLGVIRWGIWSSAGSPAPKPKTSAGQHRAAPDADLSFFERVLVKLGLAETPEPPEYRGNPRTQVWVDLQTALYYCPGADLYGKTPKGRLSSQRDAQLDQFEPAYRRACD